MSKQLPPAVDFSKSPTDAQREEQLMQDVLLLLENLVEREESTVKLILNCLYDVGATNLINQKFPSHPVNKSLRWVSKMTKPTFRMIAWQWFRLNCPQLITDWLRTQVEFQPVEMPKVEVVLEDRQSPSNFVSQEQYQISEVKQLRSQIRLLTGVMFGLVTVLTGSFLWAGYMLERSHSQVVEELQTQVKTLETSTEKP